MSLDDLAERMGVQRQLIYRYEHGQIRPSATMIARFAAALSLRIDFFSRPMPQPEPAPVFFRQFRSKTRAKHLHAVARLIPWLRDFIVTVEKYVVLPSVNVPDFHPPSDPREISDADIERAAAALRKHWGLGNGVIRDISKLVENNGCIVVPGLVKAETIDGFSIWTTAGRPIIVIACRSVSASHRRLDIAHELGHLVLHRNIDKRFLDLNPITHREIENQAFRFARAFLMPEATFRRSVPHVSLDGLLLLKPYWYLSVGAMLRRAEDLGLLDEYAAKRMWINIKRRGWKIKEPLDEQIPYEEPRLLANALETLRDADCDNIDALSEESGFLAIDFAGYSGLSEAALRIRRLPDFPTPPHGVGPLSAVR